jgi:hypothetical protein
MGSGCRGNLSIEGGGLAFSSGLGSFGCDNTGSGLLCEWVNAVNFDLGVG